MDFYLEDGEMLCPARPKRAYLDTFVVKVHSVAATLNPTVF
jgi:hypothetical protein